LCSILNAGSASQEAEIVNAFNFFLAAAGKLGVMTMTNLRGKLLDELEQNGGKSWAEEVLRRPECSEELCELCSVLLSNWIS